MAGRLGRIGRAVLRVAREEGPRLARMAKDSAIAERGKALLDETIREYRAGASGESAPDAAVGGAGAGPRQTPGRPVSSTLHQTSAVARRLDYAPDLDGAADPGEIVWTWVAFEEDPNQGKDRPVLVVGRDGSRLLGLMLSSRQKRDDDADWHPIGSGAWDPQGRESFVRLDRVLDVPEEGIRREGAILDRPRFEAIAVRLRKEYGWS